MKSISYAKPCEHGLILQRLRDNPNLTYPTLVNFPGMGYCHIVEMTAKQQWDLISKSS